MRLFPGLRARLRAALFRRAAAHELDDEIQFHVELETEKNVALGMTAEDARRVALAHFGGVQRVREEHRDVRPLRWLEDFVNDVRIGLRVIARTPTLSALAIVTIALAIGANTAIFSAVNAVILRPLPFPNPDRLVMITEENPEQQMQRAYAAFSNILDWREGVPAFTAVAAYDYAPSSAILTGVGESRRLRVASVAGDFFSVLGTRAEIGRTLQADEMWSTHPATIVLSHAAWMREFGGDTSIVEKLVTLDGASVRVVGVMPAAFAFPWENLDGWMPFQIAPSDRNREMYRRVHWMRAVARLAPGATLEGASVQLAAVTRRLEREYPQTNRGMRTAIIPLQDFLTGNTRLALLVVFASVTLLLLIACVNVGNLMLVRATGRHREIVVRLALGAGRGRLVRQAMTESLVLSTIGGAIGLALGWTGTRALVALQPDGLLRVRDIHVDASVAAYAFATTMISGLLFGAAPAVWVRRRDPAEMLKDGSRSGTAGHHMRRWADGLVIAEIALALAMTVGAGLLVRSFVGLLRLDPGFDTHGVIYANYNLFAANGFANDSARRDAFKTELVARARRIPGVTHVALAGVPPLMGPAAGSAFTVEGHSPDESRVDVTDLYVSPEYFATMRVALRRGRLFTSDDRRGTPPVVLINETFARTYFAGQDPIGQRITVDRHGGAPPGPATIVGLVADGRDTSLIEPPHIAVYHSTGQGALSAGTILMRGDGDPKALIAPMRAVFRDLDPQLWVNVRLLDDVRDRNMARPRFFAALLAAFALVGLILSAVGVYGVLAQTARNRAREIGIRVALGAPARQVQWMFVRYGLRLASAGLAIGAVVALLATRTMTVLLFGVTPNDPATFIGVALLLAVASIAASWIPAVRASRADPVIALRSD